MPQDTDKPTERISLPINHPVFQGSCLITLHWGGATLRLSLNLVASENKVNNISALDRVCGILRRRCQFYL